MPASSNLVTVLNATVTGNIYVLAPKAKYTVTGTIFLKQPNIKINLNGASLALTASAGACTNIALQAASIEIFGGTITRADCGFHSWAANSSIHDISFSGMRQFFFGDAGSVNAKLTRIKQLGPTSTVGVYFTADNMEIADSDFSLGSLGENTIREEIASATSPLPKNAYIKNTIIKNPQNTFDKQALAIRMGSATIQGGQISNMRAGQAPTTPIKVGQTVPIIVIENVSFGSDSIGIQPIDIKQGVLGDIKNCVFATTLASPPPISIDVNSKMNLVGNIRQMTVAGQPTRPLWSSVYNPPPVVSETGTVILQPALAIPPMPNK